MYSNFTLAVFCQAMNACEHCCYSVFTWYMVYGFNVMHTRL